VTLPPANYLAGSAGLVVGFLVSGFGALPPPQPINGGSVQPEPAWQSISSWLSP
jgi:hypothetical protein